MIYLKTYNLKWAGGKSALISFPDHYHGSLAKYYKMLGPLKVIIALLPRSHSKIAMARRQVYFCNEPQA